MEVGRAFQPEAQKILRVVGKRDKLPVRPTDVSEKQDPHLSGMDHQSILLGAEAQIR